MCTSSLSTNKKKKTLSSIVYISDLSFSSLSKRGRSSLAQRESSSSEKKKEEHQKHPQSCVVLTLFSAKVRARFENERERERDGELFLRRERDLEEYI